MCTVVVDDKLLLFRNFLKHWQLGSILVRSPVQTDKSKKKTSSKSVEIINTDRQKHVTVLKRFSSTYMFWRPKDDDAGFTSFPSWAKYDSYQALNNLVRVNQNPVESKE